MVGDPSYSSNDDPALTPDQFTEIAPAPEVTPLEMVDRPALLSSLPAEERAKVLASVTRYEKQCDQVTFDAAEFILTEEDARLFLEASLLNGDADYVPYAEGIVTRAKSKEGWRG